MEDDLYVLHRDTWMPSDCEFRVASVYGESELRSPIDTTRLVRVVNP